MKLTSLFLVGALAACGADTGTSSTRAGLEGDGPDYTVDPTVTRLMKTGRFYRHNIDDVNLISDDRVLVTGKWGSRIVTLDGEDLGPLETEIPPDPYFIRGFLGSLVNGNMVVVWHDFGPNAELSRVQVHDPDGALVAVLPGPFNWIRIAARVTQDRRHILLWEDGAPGEAYVRVLDAETLAETRLLTLHHWVDKVDLLTTGEIVVGDHDDELNGRLLIYDAAGALVATVPGVAHIGELKALPNGNFLTESSPSPFLQPDTVRVFDRTGALVWTDSHAPEDLEQIVVDDSTILVTSIGSQTGTEVRLFDLSGTLLEQHSGLPSASDLMRLPNGQFLSIWGAFVADGATVTPITWPVDRVHGALVVPQTGALVGWRNTDLRMVFRLDFE